MSTARIAIVGGGLSGLYAAHLLERQGVRDYVLLEARNALGGRILSSDALGHLGGDAACPHGETGGFDLGPTWYWPDLQPQLHALIRELGLPTFEQFAAGDMLVEHSRGEPALRRRGFENHPASMRLVGGMGALIRALEHRLDLHRIMRGQAVRRLRCTGAHVELDSVDASNRVATWRVEHVMLAMPPRLAEGSLDFVPALPASLARQWQAMPTWMAPHAKYIALYDTPFWREQGLSGDARSVAGPLGEIHDASMPGGSAALFGFFATAPQARRRIPEDALKSLCRAQLARLFGPQAATPKAEAFKDWAADAYTATAADLQGSAGHAQAPATSPLSGAWAGRLTGIASEWSRPFPGYLAGAVDAAHQAVAALLLPSERLGRSSLA